jgi:hypothetical protein
LTNVEDEGDLLEREALSASGVEAEEEHNGIPCCPECGRPVDDIEGMTEAQLLDAIRLGLLRDLARALRQGTATHQEKAIAKGMLRDNNSKVENDPPEEEEEVEQAPVNTKRTRPVREYRDSRG